MCLGMGIVRSECGDWAHSMRFFVTLGTLLLLCPLYEDSAFAEAAEHQAIEFRAEEMTRGDNQANKEAHLRSEVAVESTTPALPSRQILPQKSSTMTLGQKKTSKASPKVNAKLEIEAAKLKTQGAELAEAQARIRAMQNIIGAAPLESRNELKAKVEATKTIKTVCTGSKSSSKNCQPLVSKEVSSKAKLAERQLNDLGAAVSQTVTASKRGEEFVKYLTTNGKLSYVQSRAKCESHGNQLCARTTLCPDGHAGGERPAGGHISGGWAPVSDSDNSWVSLGGYWPSCQLHSEIANGRHGKPGWGTQSRYHSWRTKLPCCQASNKPTTSNKKFEKYLTTILAEPVCPKGTSREGQPKIKTQAAKMDESGCWPITLITTNEGRKRFHSCTKASDCAESKSSRKGNLAKVQDDTGCAYCPPGEHPFVHSQSGLNHHAIKINYVQCGTQGFEQNSYFPTQHVACDPGYLVGGLTKYTDCNGTPKKRSAWNFIMEKMQDFDTTSCITVLARVHSSMMLAGKSYPAPNTYNGQGVVVPEAGTHGTYAVRCKMWKKTTCFRDKHGGAQECKIAKRYEFTGLFCMMSPCWTDGPTCGQVGSHFEKFSNDNCLLPAERYSSLPAYFKTVDAEVGLCSLVSYVQ